MKTIEDGGPAFPGKTVIPCVCCEGIGTISAEDAPDQKINCPHCEGLGWTTGTSSGASIRDLFAAFAIAGMLAYGWRSAEQQAAGDGEFVIPFYLVKSAFKMADEALVRRAVPPDPMSMQEPKEPEEEPTE